MLFRSVYTGPQGTQGVQGIQGEAGGIGIQGVQGESGIQGSPGLSYLYESLNYSQNKDAITVFNSDSALPWTLTSTSITTDGSPVQIIAQGDVLPNEEQSTIELSIYRGSTEVGQATVVSVGSILPNTWTLQVIDTPTAGSYTYHIK